MMSAILSQLHGPRLRINELIAVVVVWIEPGFYRFGRSGGSLFEGDERLLGRFHPVVGNRQKRAIEMVLILIEDLHDMPVGGGVQQLENVGSGRQDLPRNLDWRAEGEEVFLFLPSALRLIVTDTALPTA